MKSLIIYDSLFGNTEKIAQAIAKGIGENAKTIGITNAAPSDVASVDLLIVGTPTHGGRPSQRMKQWLTTIASDGLKNKKVATFDTGIPTEGQKGFIRLVIRFFKYASPRLANILASKGAKILASETFFVLGKEGPLKEGELERAELWGGKITRQL